LPLLLFLPTINWIFRTTGALYVQVRSAMTCNELYFSMAVPYVANSCNNYFVYALKPCPFNWSKLYTALVCSFCTYWYWLQVVACSGL